MKTKITFGIIVLLIVVLFVGNKIVGNYIAKEIDKELQNKIDNNEIPSEVSYSEVKVNPLFSKVNITAVSAVISESRIFKCDEFKFRIPYKEALRLAQSTEFEELKSVKLQIEKPVLEDSTRSSQIALENLIIDFDGHITVEDIENMEEKFPTTMQELEISFTELQIDTPAKLNKQPINVELQKQLTNIENGSCTLIYDPETKEIHLEEMTLSSKVLSLSNNSIVHFSGDGWDSFKVEDTNVNADMVLKPNDIEWGDGDDKGTFHLSKLSISMNSEIQTERNSWPNGEFSVAIKNLQSKYAEGSDKHIIKLPIGLTIDEIDMDKFTMNYLLEDSRLIISDTELKSNIMDATLVADVEMNQENPKMSPINSAKLVIQKLSPELDSTVVNLEKQFGQTLPRENDQIVLEIIGTLGQPKIKGLGF